MLILSVTRMGKCTRITVGVKPFVFSIVKFRFDSLPKPLAITEKVQKKSF